MDRKRAALGSVIFFLLAPGVVAGLIPFWLTGWRFDEMSMALRVAGALLTIAAGLVLVSAFVRFVIEGVGTPAPVVPTQHLVIGGLYRYVRNPMYIAVTSAIVGQSLLFGQLGLLAYAAIVAAATWAFATFYEEPSLASRFGAEYEEYRRAVPGWWPRTRPWKSG